jgi:hypothetical protein
MTAAAPDERALRREAVREHLEDQPVVMAGDVAAELDVSRKTARRYLAELERERSAVRSRETSGGRVWYVEAARSDGGVPPLAEIEWHIRETWLDARPGRALLAGLGLSGCVLVFSTVALGFEAVWPAGHRRLRTLALLLSVAAWPLLVGPLYVLWRQGQLTP